MQRVSSAVLLPERSLTKTFDGARRTQPYKTIVECLEYYCFLSLQVKPLSLPSYERLTADLFDCPSFPRLFNERFFERPLPKQRVQFFYGQLFSQTVCRVKVERRFRTQCEHNLQAFFSRLLPSERSRDIFQLQFEQSFESGSFSKLFVDGTVEKLVDHCVSGCRCRVATTLSLNQL